MNTTQNPPPSRIGRPTLVVFATKGAAFLYIPIPFSIPGGVSREGVVPLKVRLPPRLARLLIVLAAARVDDAHVLEDLRGYRSSAVLRAEIEKLQGTELSEDSTVTEYVFLVRQAIEREIARLPEEHHFRFDPIENEPSVGYRSAMKELDVVTLG